MTVVINGTTGIDTGTGSLIAADATTPTYLDLFEDTDNGSNYVRLIAPTSVAANRTITLPDGTGTVVVNNVSSALVLGTVNGGAANPLSGGTSVDFTGIPSWVERITVMFNGVSTNGASAPLVQLGTSAGVTTSGYLGGGIESGTGRTAFTTGFGLVSSNAANILYGQMVITNINSNNWVASHNLVAAQSGIYFQLTGAGGVGLASTLDRVRITTFNGTDTFDAGTINILYE